MLKKLNAPQIVVVSFLCAIAIGTLMLSLPISAKSGTHTSFVDSLFTATSAACVTGLVVRDTGGHFSGFGQLVILILLQAGGLGIMTFSTVFAILLGRKLSIKDDLVIQRTMMPNKVQNLAVLIKYILFITFGIELLGAALLAARWLAVSDLSAGQVLINSVFHSISAFCNSGLSLFSNSFENFRGDIYINLIIMALIIAGGIGFIVLLEIPNLFKKKKTNKLSLQTKVVLSVSIALILIGAICFFIFESNGMLKELSLKDKVLSSFFQSVTARTTGFNTVTIGYLAAPTLLIIIVLMFIGASPGSTGGGIKTSTFGVLIASLKAMLKNQDRVSLFKRTIPKEVVRKCFIVVFLAVAWIFFAALFIMITERSKFGLERNFFLQYLFEVCSAFGTVGLSTGVTPNLSYLGKIIIIVTMFAGRVGPLTLALAIAMQREKVIYSYPEEKIMIG